MLNSLFPPSPPPKRRWRNLEPEARDRAARFMGGPEGSMQLTAEEALCVASYMEPLEIQAGQCLMREGQDKHTEHMLLVLAGEVVVEHLLVKRATPITTAIVGPGAVIGEMGLLDGSPRSATCTAATDGFCAVLRRQNLDALMQEHPAAAAKLLLSLGVRMAERLRDTTDKLKRYAALTQTMQQEIDKLMPT